MIDGVISCTADRDDALLDRVADDTGVARTQFGEDIEEAGAELRSDPREVGTALRRIFGN